MIINIDKKTNLLVDIGDKKSSPELIEELREKYMVESMFSSLNSTRAPTSMNKKIEK